LFLEEKQKSSKHKPLSERKKESLQWGVFFCSWQSNKNDKLTNIRKFFLTVHKAVKFTSAHNFPFYLRALFNFIEKWNLIHSLIATTQKTSSILLLYEQCTKVCLFTVANFYVKASHQIFSLLPPENIKLMFSLVVIFLINFQIICSLHFEIQLNSLFFLQTCAKIEIKWTSKLYDAINQNFSC
jgi:hypothetical protein